MSPNPEAQRPREVSDDVPSQKMPQLPIEIQNIPNFNQNTAESKLPRLTLFASADVPVDNPNPPQEIPGGAFPPAGNGFPPGGNGFPQGGLGLPGLRQIDDTPTWRGMLNSNNSANMMRALGPTAADYFKILDTNSPLRLNSIPMFMDTNNDGDRQRIMTSVKDSLRLGLPPMGGAFGEDAASDPRGEHRRQALRFMLTADAKLRLDRIAMNSAGAPLSDEQSQEVKKIVTNLLREEREVIGGFEDFLNGFNDGHLKVKVDGDTRFGLAADACSIRELANREKTKNMILSLERAGSGAGAGGAGIPITSEDVAKTLESLKGMASDDPPSTSAKAFIDKLAGAGVNVPKMIADLRSHEKSVSDAARNQFVANLPEMKYGAFSPAQICKSIPPELLKGIVKDEEKRTFAAGKTVTDPLKVFCAGRDGQPLPAQERKQLIAAAQQASEKQNVGAGVVSWMKFKDAQLELKDAKSPADALKALRQMRNMVDVDHNDHAASFLMGLPELAKETAKKLGLEGDALDTLSKAGDPNAERVLRDLQANLGGRLQTEMAEKGARAVLADALPTDSVEVMEKRIAELERFASAPFAKDKLDFFKTESTVQKIATSGGDKDKVRAAVNSLLDQSNAGNKYAKSAAMEMLVNENHTMALNGQETEAGVQQLVPSYKTKLESVLKMDDPANLNLVKDLRRVIAENVIEHDLPKPSERQIAIMSLVSGRAENASEASFGDKTVAERLAGKIKQTAETAPVEDLERISNGVLRSVKLNDQAHPHRVADAYLTCVERGGVSSDALRNQYAYTTDMAAGGKKEAVRIVAGMMFKPEAQDSQRAFLDGRRVDTPANELKALYTKYSTGPDASKPMAEHIQQSIKEYSERPIQALEKKYPDMMSQLMASRNNSDLRPKDNISQKLAYGHNVLADAYKHMKLDDQSSYHSAQTAEILRAEQSLNQAPKAVQGSGDIVKNLVEEMMALTSKLSIEADHARFKVGVADRFLLDCLEKCPGLRIPTAMRDGASSFKGFELNGDEFKFSGKASLALRANDAGLGLLGVDKLVNIHLDNTSAKIKVDPVQDKLTLSEIKGAKFTLDKSAGDMLLQKINDFPADKRQMMQLFAAMVKGGQAPEIEAKSIGMSLDKQENGQDVLSMNVKIKVMGMEQEIAEKVAIPREQANQVRALLAEMRVPADKRDITKYLQGFIAAGIDDRVNNFISKFDSFQKLDDGSFKCTRKEEGEFDLGNLKLTVGKTLQAKPSRGEDCSSITNIEGLSAKIPLPDELADKLKIKDAVNIKALHIGDLKDGKRKITIETDSLYKKIEIELDHKFELVKNGDGNITVNAKLAKDNNELDLVCRFNPQSLQGGKLLNSTWSFDLKGSAELKQELLGDFLKELSPLASKIETLSNNPRETKLTLTEATKLDVKGIQLSFEKEISLQRANGVRPDGGFAATVKGVDVSRFGGGALHSFIYGSKSLLKPEAIDWTPGKNGGDGKLVITPAKKSAVTEASVDINSDTLKPTAATVVIDNPIEAATSPGSHTWTSITAKLKADGNGDLQVDNMTEIVANLALKTAAMHLARPVRLIATGVKVLISLFD